MGRRSHKGRVVRSIACFIVGVGASVSASCGGDAAPVHREAATGALYEGAEAVSRLPDGCYTFSPLPDSVYEIATDLHWPRQVRWRDRRTEDYAYEFSADGLDSDWGSLASPLGRGVLVDPDSVVLSWGGESYRLQVSEGAALSGVAVLSWGGDVPDVVVGEVVGSRVACGDSRG